VPTKRPPDAEVGQALYQQSCWQCHGERGLGDGPAAAAMVGGVPSLAGKIVEEDFAGLVTIVEDGRGRMPAFAEDIDKHNARRILVYLREVMDGRIEPGKAKPPPRDEDLDDEGGPRE
jgi:mono/diheme cytochrome c family protein